MLGRNRVGAGQAGTGRQRHAHILNSTCCTQGESTHLSPGLRSASTELRWWMQASSARMRSTASRTRAPSCKETADAAAVVLAPASRFGCPASSKQLLRPSRRPCPCARKNAGSRQLQLAAAEARQTRWHAVACTHRQRIVGNGHAGSPGALPLLEGAIVDQPDGLAVAAAAHGQHPQHSQVSCGSAGGPCRAAAAAEDQAAVDS